MTTALDLITTGGQKNVSVESNLTSSGCLNLVMLFVAHCCWFIRNHVLMNRRIDNSHRHHNVIRKTPLHLTVLLAYCTPVQTTMDHARITWRVLQSNQIPVRYCNIQNPAELKTKNALQISSRCETTNFTICLILWMEREFVRQNVHHATLCRRDDEKPQLDEHNQINYVICKGKPL